MNLKWYFNCWWLLPFYFSFVGHWSLSFPYCWWSTRRPSPVDDHTRCTKAKHHWYKHHSYCWCFNKKSCEPHWGSIERVGSKKNLCLKTTPSFHRLVVEYLVTGRGPRRSWSPARKEQSREANPPSRRRDWGVVDPGPKVTVNDWPQKKIRTIDYTMVLCV